MTKKMSGITLKGEEKELYTRERRSNNKLSTNRRYKNGDKGRSHQGVTQPRRAQKNDNKSSQGRKY